MDRPARSQFLDIAERYRQQIDQALDHYCHSQTDCPAGLTEAIRYSVLAPGKRLRPMLVLMAAEACGCNYDKAMPAACAVEMVHTYSLIHDDLPAMDDDEQRRGRPTSHIKFGEAMAILAGDALLTLAFEVLARDLKPPEVAASCCAALARAAGRQGMVGGLVDDLAAEFSTGTEASLVQIHRRKTGAMFRVSLRLGGLAADASAEQMQALDTYGEKLGLAFQIVDDLLDVQGDAQALGKQTGMDEERGKLTFPKLLGIEKTNQRAKQLVTEASEAANLIGPAANRLDALARYVWERNQ